jgi:hypothetical protein
LEWLFLVVTDVIALSYHGFFIRQAFGNAASHHVIGSTRGVPVGN